MTIAELIGRNLKLILKNRGISNEKFVNMSRVSRSECYRILGGRNLPKETTISEICMALEINELELVKGVEIWKE